METQEDAENVEDELNLTEVFTIFYQQKFYFTYLIVDVDLFKTKKISLQAACSVGVHCTGRKPHQRSKIIQTKIRHCEKGEYINALLCLDTNNIAIHCNNISLVST